MATAPSTFPFFTASPPFSSAATYPPPIPYPNPIQIHGGYYPPPPYLAGYGSAPPTFPELPSALGSTPPQPPRSYYYADVSPAPASGYYPAHPYEPTGPPPAPVPEPSATRAPASSATPANAVQRHAAPSTSSSGRLPDSPGTTSAPAAALIVLCSGPGPERRPSSPSSAPVPAPSATQAHRPTPPTTYTPSASDEQEAAVLAAAQAQAREEEQISTRLPREVINLCRRLDNQQNTIDAIQGSLSNLTEMVGQIALTLKPNPNPTTSSPATTAAMVLSTCSSSLESTGTAYVAPMVFGQMPIPLSGYEHYGDGYQNPNPIQSSPVHVGNTNLHEQHVDEVPQSYCLHNLNSQRVFLADGTERRYYALPEDYPLEQAPLLVAAQSAGLAPVCCSKTNNAACSELMLVPNLQLPRTMQDVSNVFTEIPVYDESDEGDSSWLNGLITVRENAIEQQKCEDEQSICDLEKLNGGENLSLATQYVEPILKYSSHCRACHEESQGNENLLWEKSVCRPTTWHSLSFFSVGSRNFSISSLKQG